MKKQYIIGGLAVLGVIAVIAYLKKPRKNSEGFFGATGMSPFFQQTSDRNKSQFHDMSGSSVKAYYKR